MNAPYPLLRGVVALVLGTLFGAVWGATIIPLTAILVYLASSVVTLLPFGLAVIPLLVHSSIGVILIVSLYFVRKIVARAPVGANSNEIERGQVDGYMSAVGFALCYLLMWTALSLTFAGAMPL